jgi:hypothetical protein
MDAAIKAGVSAGIAAERAAWEALAKAKDDVRPIVGDVYGMDSAAKVYKYALDQRGVKAPTDDPAVLATMVGMLSTSNTNKPHMAMDHKARAGVGDIISGLGRYA